MTQRKLSAIQQALAQFDIETQVKKITLQLLDSHMNGNKQAFEYIKQWQHKFQQQQGRLTAIQTQYACIDGNIKTKMQVMDQLREQLGKFNERFYTGMKQSEASLEQMRKNYVNIVRESGAQAATIRGYEREIQQTNYKLQALQQQLNQHATATTTKLLSHEQIIAAKNNQRRSQSQTIMHKLSQAKSQLDSRTQILDTLTKDMSLYLHQKQSINTQIQQLFRQLNNRVLVSDYTKIRLYMDNMESISKGKIEAVRGELIAKVEQIEGEIKKKISEMGQVAGELSRQWGLRIGWMKDQWDIKWEEMKGELGYTKDMFREQFPRIDKVITQINKRVTKNEGQLDKTNKKLQPVDNNLSTLTSSTHQLHSNIHSLNVQLTQLQQQCNLHKTELSRLQFSSSTTTTTKTDNQEHNKAEIDQNVKGIAEKLMKNEEEVEKVRVMVGEMSAKLGEMREGMEGRVREVVDDMGGKLVKVEAGVRGVVEGVQGQMEDLRQRCDGLEMKVEKTSVQLVSAFEAKLYQNIGRMKQKFDFLSTVNAEMQAFKSQFQQQLNQNDRLNSQITQKMDRIWGMFTKLKSDIYLKIQSALIDQNKLSTKHKQLNKITDQIRNLLSHHNQLLTIVLSLLILIPSMQKQRQGNSQEYKLLSMVEGWILEINNEIVKYRGQVISKKALIQMVLQYHVKIGDKLKPQLIKNGKQIFMMIIGGSEQFLQARRRSLSVSSRKKQRQSQLLPKVFK